VILGLHGRIGAGKNACAARLLELGHDVVEVSFARKLKESAAALLDCTVEDLERWKNEPHRVVAVSLLVDGLGPIPGPTQTVRSFLQRYGTEAHRDIFGPDFWLDAALPLDRDYTEKLYVVTDVRFPNEAERVRALGGVMVEVVGPAGDTGSHVSEQPLRCDYGVANWVRDDGFASLDRGLEFLLEAVTLNRAA